MSNEVKNIDAGDLLRRAGRIVSVPTEEFRVIPAADVQKLLRDLAFALRELETEVSRLHQSMAELEETRKQYLDLFDFAPVGYFNLTSQGVILNVNITGIDMLNTPRAKLLDTPFSSLIEPQCYEQFSSHLAEVRQTGSRLSTELEMRRGDESIFYAQLQTVPLYNGGKLIYRLSVADISDRKQAEKALRESEQKYRDLADGFPEIIFETDTAGRVTYANKKVLVSFNLTAADLSQGINAFDFIVPDQKDIARQRFSRVLAEGEIGASEYTMIRKDGARLAVVVHSSRIMRGDRVAGIRGIVVDITGRKQAEQALRESEQRFRTTLDSMLEGCLIIDFDWRYIYANEAVARQGRYTREQLLGRTMMDILPGIEKTELYARLRDCMEQRVDQRIETELVYPDGSRRWFEVRAEPVPEGILVLYMNVQDRKVAEQRLQRGIERVERLYGVARTIKMQPVGMLMMEHRLIERVVQLLAREQRRMEEARVLDRELLRRFVDFIRVYADRTHHGKEEDILFKALEGKHMVQEHRGLMDELAREHNEGRKLVGDLAGAAERWRPGDSEALEQAIIAAGELARFYPRHIEKEDKQFFVPSMDYFTAQEQDDMLLEFVEFDRGRIHEVHMDAVRSLENAAK
ncbi:MAG: PAS domain S-box protein [Chloroflexi bacterium]|nr:PAS domain S-box protein [Chloroflexota bacterium]